MAESRNDITQRAAQAGQQLSTQELEIKARKSAVQAMTPEFQKAMPKGMEAVQLTRDALSVLSTTPKLAECTTESLLGALMSCAQLGLRPGINALGQAYILPLRNRGTLEAQLVIGYQGMIELVNRSPKVLGIHAYIVYSKDTFEIEYGLDERLRHVPYMAGPRGKMIGAYAVARTVNGGRAFVFMTLAELEAHRDKYALAKKNGEVFGPWVQQFEAMCMKTVVRQLFKWIPRSTEMSMAIVADESVRTDSSPDADMAHAAQGVYEGEVIE